MEIEATNYTIPMYDDTLNKNSDERNNQHEARTERESEHNNIIDSKIASDDNTTKEDTCTIPQSVRCQSTGTDTSQPSCTTSSSIITKTSSSIPTATAATIATTTTTTNDSDDENDDRLSVDVPKKSLTATADSSSSKTSCSTTVRTASDESVSTTSFQGLHDKPPTVTTTKSSLSPLGELYFRTTEIQTIKDVYKRTQTKQPFKSHIILVEGESGTGKSTLGSYIRQYHDTKQKQYGKRNLYKGWWEYYIGVNFNQLQRPEQPYGAYIQAITQFLQQQQIDIQDRSIIARNIRTTIPNADDIDMLQHAIPELKLLFKEEQEAVGNLHLESNDNMEYDPSGTISTRTIDEQQSESFSTTPTIRYNRFKNLFVLLLRAMFPGSVVSSRTPTTSNSSKETILTSSITTTRNGVYESETNLVVFYLQDFQWATELDLDLLLNLVVDPQSPHILFVLTMCPNNSVRQRGAPVISSNITTALEKSRHRITKIHLKHLNRTQTSTIVQDQLHCTNETVINTIGSQSAGNIYLLIESLRMFENETTHSLNNGELDDDTISCLTHNNFDSERIITKRFNKLTNQTKDDLVLCACLDKNIDSEIIQYLLSKGYLTSFQSAADHSLLRYDESNKCWRFSHDTVQETIYCFLSTEERKRYHYTIGRKLWRKVDINHLIQFIFVVVDQLLMGKEHIKDPDEQKAVAELCLLAGESAARVSAFHTARHYFVQGISLLDRRCWVHDRELSVRLYSGAAECCFSCGYLPEVFTYQAMVVQHTTILDDSIRVRIMGVNALGSQGHIAAARDAGMEVLKLLDEKFPKRPNRLHLRWAMSKLQRKLWRLKKAHALLNLPTMTDSKKIAAMQVLHLTVPYAYTTRHELGILLSIRMMTLTIQYGISELSCMGIALFADACCTMGYPEMGYEYGQVGLELNERFSNRSFLARFYAIYYGHVHPRLNPIQESVAPLMYAHQVGLETGDNEFSMICGLTAYSLGFDVTTLSEINDGFQALSERMHALNQVASLSCLKPLWQATQNLMGLGGTNPVILAGKVMTIDEMQTMMSSECYDFRFCYYPCALLLYLFGDHAGAYRVISEFRSTQHRLHFNPWVDAMSLMLEGLCRVSVARNARRRMDTRAQQCSRKLQKLASMEPQGYIGKYALLDAELSSLSGRTRKVTLTKYFIAISVAKESGSMLLVALANELTGKYFLYRLKNTKKGEKYLQDAIASYSRWGAVAKAQFLQCEMAQNVVHVI